MHSFIFQNLFITNLYFSTHSLYFPTHSLYISTQVDENPWQNASLSSNKNFCFPPLTPRSNENPNNSRSSSGNSNNNTCVVHIRLNRNRVHDVLLPFQNWSALTTTRLLQLLTQILARQTVPISAMPISTAVLWHSSNQTVFQPINTSALKELSSNYCQALNVKGTGWKRIEFQPFH